MVVTKYIYSFFTAANIFCSLKSNLFFFACFAGGFLILAQLPTNRTPLCRKAFRNCSTEFTEIRCKVCVFLCLVMYGV